LNAKVTENANRRVISFKTSVTFVLTPGRLNLNRLKSAKNIYFSLYSHPILMDDAK